MITCNWFLMYDYFLLDAVAEFTLSFGDDLDARLVDIDKGERDAFSVLALDVFLHDLGDLVSRGFDDGVVVAEVGEFDVDHASDVADDLKVAGVFLFIDH